MHHFLLVHTKTTSAKKKLIERLQKGVEHLVPYNAKRMQYDARSDDVLFISAQAHDYLLMGSRHLMQGATFVACDGFCHLPYKGADMAEFFLKAFKDHGIFGVNEYLNGEYCAGYYDVNYNEISGLSDFTGLRPLYYHEDNNYFAISNRQMFLNPLLSEAGNISVDINNISDLISKGNKFNDRSVLSGVKMLLPGHGIHYSPRSGITIKRSGASVFSGRGEPSKADYERAVAEIVSNFDSLENMPGLSDKPLRISLTGGEDSRLVLAAALNSRVRDRIEAFTYGTPDNPDIAAAEIVALKAGVPHVKNIQTPPNSVSERPVAEIWNDLARHAFRFEGAPGAWDGGSGASKQTRLDLVGYFDAYFKRVRPSSAAIDVVSSDIARQHMREPQQPFDPLGLLLPEAALAEHAFCDTWLEKALAEGAELNDIPELFYFDFRLPWWGGSMAANVGALYRLAPLASKFASRIGLKQSVTDRRERKFIFEAMLALRPDLLEIPYLNKKWPDHFQKYTDKIRLPGKELSLPIAQHHPSTPWQITLAKKGTDLIRDHIASYNLNDLYQVINRNRLDEILANPSLVNNSAAVRAIINLCEIIILMSGQQKRLPDVIENGNLDGVIVSSNIPELSALVKSAQIASKNTNIYTDKSPENYIRRTYTKEISFLNIKNIRIDPTNQISNLLLHSLTLKTKDGTLRPVSLLKLRKNTELETIYQDDGGLKLHATGDDPHLYFPVGYSFDNITSIEINISAAKGNGQMEIFFDTGNGFTRNGMIVITY